MKHAPRYIKDGDMSAAITGDWEEIKGFDNIGFQVKWTVEAGRSIAHQAGDAVVASTHTFTFANGAFTAADVGATLTVAGAANSNNNAAVVIATVTNATTIVTNGTQTDETFGVGVTATLVRAKPTGTFTVQTSEDGATNNQAGAQQTIDVGTTGRIALSGVLGAVTLVPSTAGTSPAANESSTIIRCNQVEAPYIRLTYAATTGGGKLQSGFAAKRI
jgi:hypothetical protein